MENLKVTYQSVSTLRAYPRNARTHSKKQIRRIAESIKQFGFTNPVLIDDWDQIIAGHGRVRAAELLGMKEVPTIRLDHLSDAEQQAYILADNRLAELAGWDREILAIELQNLTALDLDFDVEVTGFDTAEIDLLIEGLEAGSDEDEADALPPIDEAKPPVSRRGDLWLPGPHRVLCGDATAAEDYGRLLDGRQAQMVFTDPPYNVPVDGHVCGLGTVSHEDFAMVAGEMSEAQFTAFLETVFGHLAAHSLDGSIHLVFMATSQRC